MDSINQAELGRVFYEWFFDVDFEALTVIRLLEKFTERWSIERSGKNTIATFELPSFKIEVVLKSEQNRGFIRRYLYENSVEIVDQDSDDETLPTSRIHKGWTVEHEYGIPAYMKTIEDFLNKQEPRLLDPIDNIDFDKTPRTMSFEESAELMLDLFSDDEEWRKAFLKGTVQNASMPSHWKLIRDLTRDSLELVIGKYRIVVMWEIWNSSSSRLYSKSRDMITEDIILFKNHSMTYSCSGNSLGLWINFVKSVKEKQIVETKRSTCDLCQDKFAYYVMHMDHQGSGKDSMSCDKEKIKLDWYRAAVWRKGSAILLMRCKLFDLLNQKFEDLSTPIGSIEIGRVGNVRYRILEMSEDGKISQSGIPSEVEMFVIARELQADEICQH